MRITVSSRGGDGRLGRSFERFDEGGKGWLCRAELKCAIASLVGYRPPRVEVQMMLEQTHDGRVTFEQFRPAMEVRPHTLRCVRRLVAWTPTDSTAVRAECCSARTQAG
jgi:Ca2+-binding EF-hand superfamily protein